MKDLYIVSKALQGRSTEGGLIRPIILLDLLHYHFVALLEMEPIHCFHG